MQIEEFNLSYYDLGGQPFEYETYDWILDKIRSRTVGAEQAEEVLNFCIDLANSRASTLDRPATLVDVVLAASLFCWVPTIPSKPPEEVEEAQTARRAIMSFPVEAGYAQFSLEAGLVRDSAWLTASTDELLELLASDPRQARHQSLGDDTDFPPFH